MILVTGGCGFIGSHLVDGLCKGHDVVVLDRSPKKFEWPGNVKVVRGDVTDLGLVNELSKDAEAIYHLAAHVSVPNSVKNPIMDARNNIGGTLNVLEAAREGNAQVIYASSAAVYGNPEYLPMDEEHPKKPLSPYGISKLAGEHYCRFYSKTYGLKTAILRFSNVYGPRNHKAVIYNFLSNILHKKTIKIDGRGNQKRDFIFVRDVVAGLIAARKADPGDIFNLSTGQSNSINQLVDSLKTILGNVEIMHGPKRGGDIGESVLNSNKAKNRLGFRARYSLDKGLEETIRWFREAMG